ncbi:hypothetical protein [Parablautia intestinalis]|uniref:hypothetical protein n=1 Tax=Parablautia intestinalis TaxID=2320100 RepID=UPI00256EBC97|nr:hypothetical protein [Parablautia intestinalis]
MNIEIKIRHLMMVLSAIPNIEITCTDSCECFDDNKNYLRERLREEQNPSIRKILKKDIDMLDNVQAEMATARQFLFLGRCKGMKPEQVFQSANRIEKVVSEQGFEVQRMKKNDIKRFLAIYFEASMNGDQMPDADGEQFFEMEEDSDEVHLPVKRPEEKRNGICPDCLPRMGTASGGSVFRIRLSTIRLCIRRMNHRST